MFKWQSLFEYGFLNVSKYIMTLPSLKIVKDHLCQSIRSPLAKPYFQPQWLNRAGIRYENVTSGLCCSRDEKLDEKTFNLFQEWL